MSVDGGDPAAFLSSESATLGYDELNYRLWYMEDVNLHNVELDGSDLRSLQNVPAYEQLFAIDAANQSIYFLNDDRRVKSIDYNGNNLPEIGLEDSEYWDMKIDTYNR